MKRIAFYAGSFDPFTKGHLAIVCQALNMYDQVIVAIGRHPEKRPLFDAETRILLIKKSLEDFVKAYRSRLLNSYYFSPVQKNAAERLMMFPECVTVVVYDGLTVDAAVEYEATDLIRGERPIGDHDVEQQLATINRQLLDVRRQVLNQVLIPVPAEELFYVASSTVKSLCEVGEYIAAMRYVMPSVHRALMGHYLQKRYQTMARACFSDGPEDELRDLAADIDSCWRRLSGAYGDRGYHSLSHVGYCLNLLDIQARKEGLSREDKLLLERAVFYHDIVVNEAEAEVRSLQMALKDRDEEADERLAEIILATILDASCPKNCLAELMHDIDLAILGDTGNYGAYAQGVRQEFSWAGTRKYAEGRLNVLINLRGRNRLYYRDDFDAMFGEDAKQNICKEIAFWQSRL